MFWITLELRSRTSLHPAFSNPASMLQPFKENHSKHSLNHEHPCCEILLKLNLFLLRQSTFIASFYWISSGTNLSKLKNRHRSNSSWNFKHFQTFTKIINLKLKTSLARFSSSIHFKSTISCQVQQTANRDQTEQNDNGNGGQGMFHTRMMFDVARTSDGK